MKIVHNFAGILEDRWQRGDIGPELKLNRMVDRTREFLQISNAHGKIQEKHFDQAWPHPSDNLHQPGQCRTNRTAEIAGYGRLGRYHIVSL